MQSVFHWWDAYWFGFQRYEAFFLAIAIVFIFIVWLLVPALRRKGLAKTFTTFAILIACIPLFTINEEADFRTACAKNAGHKVYDASVLKSTNWIQYMDQEDNILKKYRYPFKDLGLVMDYSHFEEDFILKNKSFALGKVRGIKRQLIRRTDNKLIAESVNYLARHNVLLSQKNRSCADTPDFSMEDFPLHVYEFISPYVKHERI